MEPSIDQLKSVHDLYATTVQILTQRVQFYAEEFDGVNKLIQFYLEQMKELKAKIGEAPVEDTTK